MQYVCHSSPANVRGKCQLRLQLEQPAFYILLGGEDFASLPQAYIGQTENFKERVKSHEIKKDFWNTALVFIAKDNSLTRADVQFLEANAIKKAKKVKTYSLTENKNQPTPPNLPPHLRDSAAEFMEDIELLTTFIGCRIFVNDTVKKAHSNDQLFYLQGRGGEAKAIYADGHLTVLAGSIIAPTSTPKFTGKEKRDEMVANLTDEKNGKRILKINLEFSSPSAAAQFVYGNSANGWEKWKNAKGEPLSVLRAKE